MTTLTVTLPEPLERFVESRVASGEYATLEEAALDLLEHARLDYARKIVELNAAIQVGLDQLDHGEGIEIADTRAWIDGMIVEIEAEAEAVARTKAAE